VVEYETFTRELEALGVDEVRARLLNNQYGKVGHKREIAQDWLNRKDMAQHREIAKRASDAAERAANAAAEQAKQAQRANRVAIASLIVSLIAAGMSLFALLHPRG
jgi:hypothetical protein